LSDELLFSLKDLENRFADKLAGRPLLGTRWQFKGKEEYLELLVQVDSPVHRAVVGKTCHCTCGHTFHEPGDGPVKYSCPKCGGCDITIE